MSKYTKGQLVEITSGYLKGEVFEVIDKSNDSAGIIYRLVGGKHQGETIIWRYERELKAYKSARNITMLELANSTPAQHSFSELMNLIHTRKLEGIPDPLAI